MIEDLLEGSIISLTVSIIGYNFAIITDRGYKDIINYPVKIDLYEQNFKDQRFKNPSNFITYYVGFLGRKYRNNRLINRLTESAINKYINTHNQ